MCGLDGDKIGALGIQLNGKAGMWYRALKDKEKNTWDTLRGSFILEFLQKVRSGDLSIN